MLEYDLDLSAQSRSQVFTADDMAEDGDAMEDAKAQIYGRSKRGRQ